MVEIEIPGMNWAMQIRNFSRDLSLQTLLFDLFRAAVNCAIISQFRALAERETRPFRVHPAQNREWLNESRLMCNRLTHDHLHFWHNFRLVFQLKDSQIPKSYLHRRIDVCVRNYHKKRLVLVVVFDFLWWLLTSPLSHCHLKVARYFHKFFHLSSSSLPPLPHTKTENMTSQYEKLFIFEKLWTTFDWFKTPELAGSSHLRTVSITSLRQVMVDREKITMKAFFR